MDYKKHIAEKLASCGIDKEEIEAAIAVPPDNKMGDYALPCFKFAKVMRKSPVAIAEELKNTFATDDAISEVVGQYRKALPHRAFVHHRHRRRALSYLQISRL